MQHTPAIAQCPGTPAPADTSCPHGVGMAPSHTSPAPQWLSRQQPAAGFGLQLPASHVEPPEQSASLLQHPSP